MMIHESRWWARVLGWVVVGALGLAAGAAGAQGIRTERILGPEVKTGDYKHPASFSELANGDLYLAFFSGGGEYSDSQAAVFGTRLKRGGTRWSKPEKIASHPFHALGNPVVWQAPDGPVWLFYVTRYGTNWADSRIAAKISRDGARSWSESFVIAFEAGMMVRSRPLVLTGGDVVLPIYHEVGRDTEQVGPDCTSLFLRLDPTTHVWVESNRVRSRLGNIQPAAVEVAPGHLVAYSRRGGDYEGRPDGWLVRTESRDGGRTWSEGVDSEFPNPNAAVDFIRLRNGHLALVYNDSFTNRTPLTVAISTDGGRTFAHRRNLAEGPGDFAYPTAIQTRDGKIQVLYTSDERTVLRRAVFDESEVTGAAAARRPVLLYSRYFNAPGEGRYLPDGTYREVLSRLGREYEVRVHAEPLTRRTLEDVAVVLISNPSDRAVGTNRPPAHVSAADARELSRYVERGGGLIVLGNQENHNLEIEDMNRLLERFGLAFTNVYTDAKRLVIPAPTPLLGGLRWAYYTGNQIRFDPGHAARPRGLVLNDSRQKPVGGGTRDAAGCLLATAEPGRGRVVVVTDAGWITDMALSGAGIGGVSIPDHDNWEIFRRLTGWVAAGSAGGR